MGLFCLLHWLDNYWWKEWNIDLLYNRVLKESYSTITHGILYLYYSPISISFFSIEDLSRMFKATPHKTMVHDNYWCASNKYTFSEDLTILEVHVGTLTCEISGSWNTTGVFTAMAMTSSSERHMALEKRARGSDKTKTPSHGQREAFYMLFHMHRSSEKQKYGKLRRAYAQRSTKNMFRLSTDCMVITIGTKGLRQQMNPFNIGGCWWWCQGTLASCLSRWKSLVWEHLSLWCLLFSLCISRTQTRIHTSLGACLWSAEFIAKVPKSWGTTSTCSVLPMSTLRLAFAATPRTQGTNRLLVVLV